MDRQATIGPMTLTKVITLAPSVEDRKSGNVKRINLTVEVDSTVTLDDFAATVLASEVIRFQNSKEGRDNFDNLVNGQKVVVHYRKPIGGSKPMSFEDLRAKVLAATTPEEKAYWKGKVVALLEEMEEGE